MCPGEAEDCVFCHGTGTYTYEIFPFERNMANANFVRFMKACGVEVVEYCGAMDGRRFMRILDRLDRSKARRQPRQETTENGATIYEAGMEDDLIDSYLSDLCDIAAEAEAREERVTWA